MGASRVCDANAQALSAISCGIYEGDRMRALATMHGGLGNAERPDAASWSH